MSDLCHSQMHACSFAYVHNFAIGRQDKHETVQSLKSKEIFSFVRDSRKREDEMIKKKGGGEEYSGSLEVRVQRLVTALISFVLNRTVFNSWSRPYLV